METQPAAELRCLNRLVMMLIGILRGFFEFLARLDRAIVLPFQHAHLTPLYWLFAPHRSSDTPP